MNIVDRMNAHYLVVALLGTRGGRVEVVYGDDTPTKGWKLRMDVGLNEILLTLIHSYPKADNRVHRTSRQARFDLGVNTATIVYAWLNEAADQLEEVAHE